ncbi:MAG: peptide deformylase, partial [Bacteroidota bacterium]
LLGNPVLRKTCAPVRDLAAEQTRSAITDLRDTLEDFRQKRGFGRGIAAPQIGLPTRILFIDFEHTGPLINPRITGRSRRTFLLWDDCFSFPDILVKVERHYQVTVRFTDEAGRRRSLRAEGGLSELLQHEIDHLDGILAIDRAVDSKHIILRSEFERLTKTLAGTL